MESSDESLRTVLIECVTRANPLWLSWIQLKRVQSDLGLHKRLSDGVRMQHFLAHMKLMRHTLRSFSLNYVTHSPWSVTLTTVPMSSWQKGAFKYLRSSISKKANARVEAQYLLDRGVDKTAGTESALSLSLAQLRNFSWKSDHRSEAKKPLFDHGSQDFLAATS